MFLVGLTGGIAAGKSSVAEVWGQLGATVVDSDELAREVVLPGSHGLAKVIETFGDGVLSKDGSLNRKALSDLVFTNVELRRSLEAILHPLIKALAIEKLQLARTEIVVYVIPLLVETKSDLPFDFVVTVEAPESYQIQRMMESRSMKILDAIARIRSQVKPAERANAADLILSSNQTLGLLQKDATVAFKEIQRLAASKKLGN